MNDVTTPKPRQHRGFAAMDPERRREIARKGGAGVNPANRSFAKDRALAASAGKKGGEASRGGGRYPKPKEDLAPLDFENQNPVEE